MVARALVFVSVCPGGRCETFHGVPAEARHSVIPCPGPPRTRSLATMEASPARCDEVGARFGGRKQKSDCRVCEPRPCLPARFIVFPFREFWLARVTHAQAHRGTETLAPEHQGETGYSSRLGLAWGVNVSTGKTHPTVAIRELCSRLPLFAGGEPFSQRIFVGLFLSLHPHVSLAGCHKHT